MGLAVLLAVGTSFLTFRAACAVTDARPGMHVQARQYIKLPPIALKSSSEQLVITITLEVAADRKEAVEKLQPQLIEAFSKDLAASFSGAETNRLMQGKTLDMSAVRELLIRAAQRTCGHGAVRDILLDVQQGRT